MKKIVLAVIGVAFIGFFSWRVVSTVSSKSQAGGGQPGARPPVAVQVVRPSVGTIRDTRQFTGSVYPIYQYLVSPKVSGRVIEIRKRIGDSVRKGEIIARIDDAEYQQAVLEAEANLKIAEASLVDFRGQAELAAQEMGRAQSLREKGISSTAEYDAAVTSNTAQQARLKLAQAQVDQRQAALSSARIRLGYTVLTAPEPGLVGERFVDEGALLAPNSPVITVVGIDRVIVRTTIIERDYGSMKPGQEATVTVDAFPTERFTGTVSRIAPMLQESSRVAQTEIEVDNPSHSLKPGMFARIDIILEEHQNAQIVPSAALVSRQGADSGHGVFVVETNSGPVARFVPIELGITNTEMIEILSPTIDGMVITLGQHLLTDGSPVILPETTGDPGNKPDQDVAKSKPGAPGKGARQ